MLALVADRHKPRSDLGRILFLVFSFADMTYHAFFTTAAMLRGPSFAHGHPLFEELSLHRVAGERERALKCSPI
jgi:hypothetical protein